MFKFSPILRKPRDLNVSIPSLPEITARNVYAVCGGVSKFAKARPDKTFQAVVKESYDYAISSICLEFDKFTEIVDGSAFVLILVEFEGADTLFLGRLMGVDPDKANLDWIGMKVEARYIRNSQLKPTDVYFTPV